MFWNFPTIVPVKKSMEMEQELDFLEKPTQTPKVANDITDNELQQVGKIPSGQFINRKIQTQMTF